MVKRTVENKGVLCSITINQSPRIVGAARNMLLKRVAMSPETVGGGLRSRTRCVGFRENRCLAMHVMEIKRSAGLRLLWGSESGVIRKWMRTGGD